MLTIKLFGAMLMGEADPPEETLTVCVCPASVEEVVEGISTEWI